MANSSKTKTPLRFGWLVKDNQYHIAIINKAYFSSTDTYFGTAYACLCDKSSFLAGYPSGIYYMWPNGSHCTEVLCKDTICHECLTIHEEDLTFPLIKAKLGVKNPFD